MSSKIDSKGLPNAIADQEIRKALTEKTDVLEKNNADLKEMQDLLIQSEKFAATGRMVAGIIHEIRTPLTGIMGYHQLLKMKIQEPLLLEYLSYCIHAVEKIKNTVTDLLNFSNRIHDCTVQILDVETLFKNMETLIHIISKQENIKISILFPNEKIYLRVDLGHVEEIIMALVNHALCTVKAAKAMGQDHSSLLDMEDFEISLSAGVSRETGEMFFQVADRGLGFNAEKKHMLESLCATRSAGEGSRLSLALCKSIVESLHGRITADSGVNRGNTFKVFFPLGTIK
jgi:two-component system NtrC family sensor kinase